MTYKLENKFIKLEVDSFGAQLSSLKKINDDIEYLWQKDPIYWNKSAPVLFPIVGRLKDDEYFFNEKIYKMNQHGFARDYEFEQTKKTDTYISFLFKENDETLKKYPFKFTLEISYELINSKVKVSYKVKNKSDDMMYFSIGAHPAFNWPLNKEDKNSYYFLFENLEKTNRYFLNKNGLVDSLKELNINQNKLYINEEIFKDDALVFNDKNIQTITLKSFESSRFIKMNFEGFDYLGLWSKPSGAPFVCIEPWHGIADDKNTNKDFKNKRGILDLQKDEEFSSFYTIEI